MDTIGSKLRSAREAKKLTIRDVVKDSKISSRYIQALEEENFDKFPSETYLIGFLRAYAEHLKLNPTEMVNAYKGFKIGESDTPVEELTKPIRNKYFTSLTSFLDRNKNAMVVSIIALGIVLFIGAIISFYGDNIRIDIDSPINIVRTDHNKNNVGSEIQKVTAMQLHSNRGIEVVRRNEALSFLVDNNEVVIVLKDIVNKEAVIEIMPGNKTLLLAINEQQAIEFDDIVRNVTVTLRAATRNSAKLMVSLSGSSEPQTEPAPREMDSAIVTGVDSTSVIVQNPRNLRIILEAHFRQRSYLELYLDANKRFGGYVAEGRREVWDANESIQLRLGNAGGVDIRINGRSYNFGSPGQVVNKTITWRKDIENPNLYHIVVKDSH